MLGRVPGQSGEFLDSIGYLAQEVPLYKRLSADDHLEFGAHLNRRWDPDAARARLAALRIPADRPVATLSGGQRAQVGLSLALAKRPQVLLLDEPVAALDPLARREFLASLAEAAADGDLSVVVSSHLLHDLERVCDHLILLAASRTQVCGGIDEVLATHRVLIGPRRAIAYAGPGLTVIKATQTPPADAPSGPPRRPGPGSLLGSHRDGAGRHRPGLHGRSQHADRQHADRDRAGPVNVLVWRLHRPQAYIACAALAALGVLLAITGITITRHYHAFLASCAAARSCGHTGELFAGDAAITSLVNATMAVPLLFGLFWGAPLLAREFEDGTHNLAWTQGVTRIRWLTHTAGWPLLAAAGWGAAMAALVSWWRGPQNAAGAPVRLATFTFDIQGIAPVAYAVFAVALGIAAGALLRRVLPAMAATFTVFTGLRFVIAEYARPHYLAPLSWSYPPFSDNAAPRGSLVLSNATLGPDGHNYTAGLGFQQVPPACRGNGQQAAAQLNTCLASHGFHTQILYQPASRFWTFQGIEAGLFILLATALIAVAYRIVLARDA